MSPLDPTPNTLSFTALILDIAFSLDNDQVTLLLALLPIPQQDFFTLTAH